MMKAHFKERLRKGARGSVIAYAVLSILFLLLAVGLGVDISHLYLAKTELQNTADAAALAGSTALVATTPPNKIQTAVDRAIQIMNANRYNFDKKDYVNVMSLAGQRALVEFAVNLNGPYVDEATATANPDNIRFVRVTTPTVPINIFFASPILGTTQSLNARAVAGAGAGNSACMYALDTNDEKAFSVTSDSHLNAACGIAVNSSAYNGFNVESASSVTASVIDVVGGSNVSGSTVSVTPNTGASTVTDPLSYLVPPTFGGCNHTDYKASSQNVTLNPGVYCNGISIESGSTATFNPGMYVLLGGGLKVASGSSGTGTGITFFNTANSSYSFKPILIESNTTVNFSAPTSGPYTGVLFYQDPTQGSIDDLNLINVNNTVTLSGALYFPTQPLLLQSNTTGYIDGLVVARTIRIESGSNVNITNSLGGLSGAVPPVLYR